MMKVLVLIILAGLLFGLYRPAMASTEMLIHLTVHEQGFFIHGNVIKTLTIQKNANVTITFGYHKETLQYPHQFGIMPPDGEEMFVKKILDSKTKKVSITFLAVKGEYLIYCLIECPEMEQLGEGIVLQVS